MRLLVRPFALPPTLTIATRDAVRDAALRALAEGRAKGAATWIVEAAAVESFDAAGLGVLLLLEKRAREAGLRFVLRAPAPIVAAAIQAAGLTALLGTTPD